MPKGSHKRGNLKHRYPFVSVCTPTFNRRPFIPALIKCFQAQDYPKDRMEWIIVDDGTDKIEDLVKDIPQVKYLKYDRQMNIGEKRNISNKNATGDIIVYMDDDDYYYPTRVSHAVQMLRLHPKALCAGSSKMLIYFKHIEKMYQLGPYNNNHSTAATLAFKRKLLEQTSFEDNAALAEEKHFLKNYTVPFIQLDCKQTCLVFSHRHNTFDKKSMLDNPNPKYTKPSSFTLENLIKNAEMRNFYSTEIDSLLENYKLGESTLKPEVLRQQQEMKKNREQTRREMPIFRMKDSKGVEKDIDASEIVNILNKKEVTISELQKQLQAANKEIDTLKTELKSLKE
mgnify:CR=1 FL=1|tara:strand:- start:4671 stop:5693 length:1023 start_codon:yes stop_codon:yes gene_type:complete